MEEKQSKKGGLNKSLKLVFVYTVATGSIFTFVNYWDSVFYGYCGTGTFLAFALMTIVIDGGSTLPETMSMGTN